MNCEKLQEKKKEIGKTVRLSKNKWALCRVAATVVNAKTVAPEKQFGKKSLCYISNTINYIREW